MSDLMSRRMKSLLVCAAALLLAAPALAQTPDEQPAEAPPAAAPAPKPKVSSGPPPKSIEDLLEQVRQGSSRLSAEEEQREQAFIAAKEKQAEMLAAAQAEEQRLVARSGALELQYEENEKKAVELAETLRQRMGTSGELFGIVRQVAGDTRGHIAGSLISAQLTGREAPLAALGESKKLPTIDELEGLWFILLQEMAAQGEVVRFETEIIGDDGQSATAEVVRVGPFNAVSEDKFLQWLPEVEKLSVLGRQPPEMYRQTATALSSAGADASNVRFAVDPSRGAVLSLLVQTPELEERLEQGGVVGYAILALGAVAAAWGLLRLLYLLILGFAVSLQRRKPAVPGRWNPLGRVLRAYHDDPGADVETLERRLDDAITRQSGRLELGHWVVKVVSVVAPLMGLLGTVTGMIQTFQAITLFGTGDPKLMAGGISEALVTTMLGLVVAIPLVLLHSGINNMARRVADVLYEQATGLIARQAEKTTRGGDAGGPAEAGA